MEIIIGKTAGFCYGVKNAVDKTKDVLKLNEKTYCLGEIVHNRQVVDELEKLGLIVIDDIDEIKEKANRINIIIRAHGVTPEIYKKIEEREYNLIDLTCPNVLVIHKIVEEYRDKGYYILLVGQKNHPEIIGTYGFCKRDEIDNCYIIETKDDINNQLEKLLNLDKILVITQTTFSLEKFNDISKYINEKIMIPELKVINTICNATKIKQEETEIISKEVQYMIIIGGKNSSNTRKLYDISLKNCDNCIIIENSNEINIDDIKNFKIIGIMAGASTPNSSIEEVTQLIKSIK